MSTRSRLCVVAIGIVAFYSAIASALDFVVDDTFISLRYAENFANGHGLVYNPGERVEGYSNFLWVILISAVISAFPDVDAFSAARILGIVSSAATILLLTAISSRLHPRLVLGNTIAALLLACSNSFAIWSVAGLEATFFALTIAIALFAFSSDAETRRTTLIAGLAATLPSLVRADGFIIFFLLTGARLQTPLRRDVKWLRRENVLWIVPFAVIFFPYLAFRLSYYGYPLPNTYYAKVSFGLQDYVRGLEYLAQAFYEWGPLVFALMLLPLVKRRATPVLLASMWVAYGWLVYVVSVGGDVMPFFRFVVFIAPVIFLLAQEGILELLQWSRAVEPPLDPRLAKGWSFVAVAMLSVFLARETFRGFRNENRHLKPYIHFVAKCEAAGRWLESNTEKDALIAMTPAGATAYYSKRPVIDMLGLNDLHIGHLQVEGPGIGWQGHEKGDGEYVLSRRPEYILLGNVAVEPEAMTKEEVGESLLPFVSENEIWQSEEFHASYEFLSIQIADSGPHQHFMLFKRKSADQAGSMQ